MVFLIPLLIGTQILCCLSVSPPRQKISPPPPPDRWICPPCNSSSIKAVAELALDKLNEDRREGYVLGLQRIFDVHQLQWQGTGVVYYLILDVLETNCHVLSRKSQKDCPFRHAYETVYGQCKVIFYINKPWRILHLFSYECNLHPLPASAITKFCPDCPVPSDPTQPRFQEAATESLAKFNRESNHAHYFNVRKVTRARSQWVVGPSLFVEYIIQETSCSKSQDVSDLSKCPFLPDERADVGVCKGSVVDSQAENQKHISADCEIFHKEPPSTGEQQTDNRKPGHREKDQRHGEDDHPGARRSGLHDHQHQSHDPRDQHHGHHSHDHAGREQNPPASDSFEGSTDLGKTVGWVRIFPSSNTQVPAPSSPETEAERLDGIPMPPESQRPKPEVNRPDIHGAPEESRPLGKPGLTKPGRPVTPPPFPTEFSQSDTCPGEILVFILGLEPLLPQRPAGASQSRAPEFQVKENVKH